MNQREKELYLREYSLLKAQGKPFFPYAVAKDSVMACVVLLSIITMSIIFGAELGPLVRRGQDERGELGAGHAGRGGQPLGARLQRHEEVRRDRPGRVVGGAILGGDARGDHPEPLGERARDGERALGCAVDRRSRAAQDLRRAPRRHRHQRGLAGTLR